MPHTPTQRRNEISIGALADRTGLAVSAIRYYETQGLVAPERNAGGQRRFLRSDIRRLSFVMIAQKFGLSHDFRAELDEQIAALTRLRDKLDGCIGCGCLSLDRCALYNPDDAAGEKGAGPRYLLGDEVVAPKG